MADYYVDENGKVTKKKKKNQASYTVDSNGRVSVVKREEDDEDDIAPVRKQEKEDEGKDDFLGLDFLQKGAFSDGYQFGDLSRAHWGTMADIGSNVAKGILRTVEGVTDAVGYLGAGAADLVGADGMSKKIKSLAQKETVTDLFAGVDKAINKNSVLGRTTDSIFEGVGQVGTMIATGGIGQAAGLGVKGVTALTTGLMGASGFGSGMGEAYKGGASDKEAVTYGLIAGTADALTEMIFGGLGKSVKAIGISKGLSSADDMLAKTLSSKIQNTIAKNAVQFGVKASGEGLEEVLAGLAQGVGKKLTYMSEKDLGEIIEDENLLEQFVVGAFTSGITQASSLHQANQSGRDFITNMNANEEAVVSKEAENRIAEEEKKTGEKMSAKEKNAVYEAVQKDMDKGYISIDTIEQTLAGDEYKAYQDALTQEEAIRKEHAELADKPWMEMSENQRNRLEHLKKEIEGMKTESKSLQAKKALDTRMSDLMKDSRLSESYNERTRKGQAFQADLSKYDEKLKPFIQNAIDSKILNNTNRTHEFVETLAKISADKGVPFNFTNNAKLKESGFAVEGKTVNGFVNKDGITINIQSPTAWQSTVGHEITHVLEGTELYQELQDSIIQYAKDKGDYQGRIDSLTRLYQGIKGADINAELTADLVGEYLFNDSDFVNSLSTSHRNIFQKIYDEVKYLLKVVTAGSKEAKQLEKVKRAFEKAYQAGDSNTQNNSTKYHISGNLSAEIDKVLRNEASKNSQVKARDFTPEILVQHGVPDLPMLITQNHVKSTIYTEEEAKNAGLPTGKGHNYHGLGKELLIRSIDSMDNPSAIYKKDDSHYLIIAELQDADGNDIMIPVKIDGRGTYNDVYIDENQILSVYGKKNLDDYIARNGLEAIYKKGEAALNEGVQYSNISDLTTDSISQNSEKSSGGGKFSFSESDQASDTYSRIYDMQVEVNHLRESIREFESTVEFKAAMDKLSQAIKNDDIENGVKAYQQWRVESGYDELVNRRDSLQVELDNLRKEFDESITNKAVNAEKLAIEKSGLSEAEYFRKQAVKEFGYTPYFYDAGYITQNGKMLNFSGEKGKHYGTRGQDHRAIGTIYADTEGTDALNRFVNDGNIRIMAESPGLDISAEVEPTKEQYATIRRFIYEYANKEYFSVDLSGKDGRVVGTLEYENRINPARILNDIKHYYATGEIREQSSVDKFRYSLSEDSEGRPLSKAVQSRFGNSKVVDENGSLKVVYHGTASGEFSIFDKTKGSVEGDFGRGFYFTDNESDVSEHYEGGGPDFENKVAQRAEQIESEEEIDYDEAEKRARDELFKGSHKFEVYLNMENPAIVGETILFDNSSYLEQYNEEDYDDYDDYIGDVEQLLADDIENIVWEVERNTDADSTDGLVDVLYEAYYDGGIGIEELKAKINDLYLEDSEGRLIGNEVARQVIESLGYDGIIDPTVSGKWNMDIEEGTTHYIVFKPNQIKAVTNENPTDNPDIHRSLSEEGEAPTYGTRGTPAQDLYLESEEDIAPMPESAPTEQEAVQVPETATNAPKPMEEDYAPLSEEEANALQDENLASLTDEDAPPEMEAPSYEPRPATAPDPFEKRDMKEVGNRKVKAYMFENPEVKPFFQDEARIMLGELRDTVKGERFYTETDTGIYWTGTNRLTSDDIAYLRDVYNYSYAEIEKGLNAIIEDNGAENNAVSKRIEFILNERLLDGYTGFLDGVKIPPNSDYINLINEQDNLAFNEEASRSLLESGDLYAPPVREEALEQPPVAEPTETPIAEEVAPTPSLADQEANEGGFVPDKPIKTVKERIEAKVQSLQTELDNNQANREASRASYDEEIARLQADYNARKNKNTKAANDILRRIERTRRFRDSVDADYAKRISDTEAKLQKARDEQRSGESPSEQVAMRRELHTSIIERIKGRFAEMGFDFDEVLKKAKNLATFSTVDNTPQRVMEKSLGYQEGGVLADLTVNQVAQNETEGIKWLNRYTDRKNGLLAQISRQYNIKPGSHESAAAQMYAEGFYVGKNDDIIEYGDKELAKDFPDLQTQANIKGLAHDPRIRRIYDETLAMINESRARNAYPEIKRLDNYFLHFRAMDDTFSRLGLPFNPNDIKAKDLPTDLNGVTADLKPGQPYFASAMHRTGKRTSFDLLGGLESYLSSAKNQIYHIDDIQTLRALRNYVADNFGQAKGLENLDALSEEEQQEKIKEVYGAHLSTFAKFLNEEANVIAGKTALIDRGLEGIIGRRGIQTLDTINRQVGANMVGFNVSSSLTNFLSVAQAFAKTNKADFLKGFAQTVYNKMASIQGRGDTFAQDSSVMIRRKGADRFYRKPVEKVSDAGYVLMSAVDEISTEIIARAKYNEFIRNGMDSEQAHYKTDKWVSRLMGDRSLGQQPQLYNSKMLGLLTKFQLEVRNQLDSQFYDTIQEEKAKNEGIENAQMRNAKTAAKVASTFFQLAVAQHVFGKVFESVAGYNPAFDIIEAISKAFGWDDEEEDEDTVLDNIEQGFLSLLGDMPYSSILTGGRIPIESALPIEQFVTGKDKYGNEKSRLDTLKEAAPYYLLPGGYGQIKKTVQGLSMFDDDLPVAGSYTDSGNLRFPVEDTLGNRIQAGIFGQYASGNARDYFDNERKPLAEKQIGEYADLDIPIQDYWKIRDGMAKQDKLEGKLDYIDSLDLPIDKKNILANNAAGRKEPIDLSTYDQYASLEEFDFAQDNPEKYDFFTANGISYEDYKAADEDGKRAYTWAYENPEAFEVAKVVAGDVISYRQYTSELNDIRADKDENGKTINGSAKQKKIDYINGLDLDYGQKIILFKSEYEADNTYNQDILDYLNNRGDLSYDQIATILTRLGYRVTADGSVYWD